MFRMTENTPVRFSGNKNAEFCFRMNGLVLYGLRCISHILFQEEKKI